MRKRLEISLGAALLTASLAALPLRADPVPADCAALTTALQMVKGYSLTVPPAGPEAGWCVLDGVALRSEVAGQPDLKAERLRLRGTAEAGALLSLEVDLAGLRVTPAAGDRAVADWLREMARLQSAALRFSLTADTETDRLFLRGGILQLSGGTELTFAAEARGAGLSLAALPGAALMAVQLEWRNDGRLPRPAMEALGESLVDGAQGTAAVDAARLAMRQLADNLPDAALTEGSRGALGRLIAALPQGRGKASLSLASDEGIGAMRLLMTGMEADPLGPEALARLLQDTQLSVGWTPGLAP